MNQNGIISIVILLTLLNAVVIAIRRDIMKIKSKQ